MDNEIIKFAEGTQAMHEHAKRVAVVWRDDGGETVYCCYKGTNQLKWIPRGALVPIEVKQCQETPKKAKKEASAPLNKDPLSVEVSMFMREVYSPELLAQLDKHFDAGIGAFRHTKFGMMKMRLGNVLRNRLKSKQLTTKAMWLSVGVMK